MWFAVVSGSRTDRDVVQEHFEGGVAAFATEFDLWTDLLVDDLVDGPDSVSRFSICAKFLAFDCASAEPGVFFYAF